MLVSSNKQKADLDAKISKHEMTIQKKVDVIESLEVKHRQLITLPIY